MRIVKKVFLYATSVSLALSGASIGISAEESNTPIAQVVKSVEDVNGIKIHFVGPVPSNSKIDPTEITLFPKFTVDDARYILTREDGSVVEEKNREFVTNATLNNLPAGNYRVAFEYELDGGKYKLEDSFKVVLMSVKANIDKEINPTRMWGESPVEEALISWEITKKSGELVAGDLGSEVPKKTIDSLEKGKYQVKFTAMLEGSPKKHSEFKEFEITDEVEDGPEVSLFIDRPINPKSITGDKKLVDSKLEWTIKNGATVLHTGEGKTVTQSLVDALPAGTYQVSFKETSKTGKESVKTETFTMRYPNPTVSVDKAENPTKIEATPAIAESTLKWVITSATGDIKSGTGSVIVEDLQGLADGTYTVTFTEKSPEGLTKDASATFTTKTDAVLPEVGMAIDRYYNPTSITGSKKLSDSTLEWTIGYGLTTVHTGTGESIPQDILTGLSARRYFVTYVERSVTGEISRKLDEFEVRYPNPTITVDKAENPTKIEATPAIAESTLKWVITSATGDIKSGTGSVTVEDLQGLADGTYTVTFTETSPEGLSKDASATFTTKIDVVLPEVGMTIDRYYNPTSITGSKKLSDSTLEWTIGYGLTTVPTGTGESIPQEILTGLSARRYFVTYVERSVPGEISRKLDEFEVRYPNPTVTLNASENPTTIGAIPAIKESTLTWVITSATGDIKSGTSSVIAEELKDLVEGTYTVTFTETSPEGLTKEGTADFTISKAPILVPQAQIKVDRLINPRSVTGDKKLVDSKLGWTISQDTTVLYTGEGNTVTQSLIDTLPAGIYVISFTETSTTGLVSKVSETITMRYPNPIISLDKTENPTKIEATPAITESGMKWVITSATGDIKSGTGLVIDEALKSLETGSYTVVFTETSPEGLEKSANATFNVNVATGVTDNESGTVDGGEKLPATGINNSIAQLGLFTSFMGVIVLLLEKLKRRV